MVRCCSCVAKCSRRIGLGGGWMLVYRLLYYECSGSFSTQFHHKHTTLAYSIDILEGKQRSSQLVTIYSAYESLSIHCTHHFHHLDSHPINDIPSWYHQEHAKSSSITPLQTHTHHHAIRNTSPSLLPQRSPPSQRTTPLCTQPHFRPSARMASR